MVKSHKKKSQNYFRSMVKCRQNVSYKEIDIEPSAERKMIDFDYCEEYLMGISNKFLLR